MITSNKGHRQIKWLPLTLVIKFEAGLIGMGVLIGQGQIGCEIYLHRKQQVAFCCVASIGVVRGIGEQLAWNPAARTLIQLAPRPWIKSASLCVFGT